MNLAITRHILRLSPISAHVRRFGIRLKRVETGSLFHDHKSILSDYSLRRSNVTHIEKVPIRCACARDCFAYQSART